MEQEKCFQKVWIWLLKIYDKIIDCINWTRQFIDSISVNTFRWAMTEGNNHTTTDRSKLG
ncbi:MAG TPA: hypothetical protein VJL78_02945 [Candidatus Nitrosocosmicus sp.]|nr:hypothetical protein [Candidatus Nitrosocosmicus sp.]